LIALGSDHAGFALKQEIRKYLESKGYKVKDFGTEGVGSVDYPDFGLAVAEAVAKGECDRGIVICGTGIGISISANKVPGVRAALCTDTTMARLSREHNDANVLALGERIVGVSVALDIVDTWLETAFLKDRHTRRVGKIAEIENKYSKKCN